MNIENCYTKYILLKKNLRNQDITGFGGIYSSLQNLIILSEIDLFCI